ncbi:MAG: HEAT repeat domain-containing protein [Pseudomonadota bacterium]
MADTVLEQIAALGDEDWAVREDAAVALGGLRDKRAVEPLIAVLRDSDRAVREASVAALTAIGEPAVEPLGACLRDQNLTVQESAAAILASIGDARVADELIAALTSADWVVRMHAAKALGRIGEARTIPALMPLLQDKVKAVREEVSGALARLGPAAIPVLVEALTHEEWLARLHAVESLGKTKSPDAVDPLLRLLFNDRDSSLREDAVRALGDIGDARAVEFLLTAMKEPGLRPLITEALGKIGDRRAVPALVAVVEGTNRPEQGRTVTGCGDQWTEEMAAQASAARSLGQIRDASTIPTLVAALKNTVTRAEAATALVAFGPTAIPHLVAVLKNEQDGNILFHVKEALAQLGWRQGRM